MYFGEYFHFFLHIMTLEFKTELAIQSIGMIWRKKGKLSKKHQGEGLLMLQGGFDYGSKLKPSEYEEIHLLPFGEKIGKTCWIFL